MRRISTSAIRVAVLVVLMVALYGCSRAVGQRAGESISLKDAGSHQTDFFGVAGPTPTPYACPGCWNFVTQDENFDSVKPPELPPDWLAINAQGPPPFWVTSNSGVPMPPADTLPNALYIDDPPVVSDKLLDGWFVDFFEDCCVLLIFRHNFNFDASEVDHNVGFDGGVLEMSTDGGNTFQDILDAGGSFVTGGYNRTIATDRGSPIAGRQAWSGNSGGFITTAVNVPNVQGQGRLRWRMASDESGGNEGWRVDTLHMTWCKGMGPPCTPTPTPPATPTPTATGTPTVTPTVTPTPTLTPSVTPTPTPTPTETCRVSGADFCDSVVSTPPTEFGVGVTCPIDPFSGCSPGGFTVNSVPADSCEVTDLVGIIFHFNTSPVIGGLNAIHVDGGTVSCCLRQVDEFSCTFFYKPLRFTPTPRPRPTPLPRPHPSG